MKTNVNRKDQKKTRKKKKEDLTSIKPTLDDLT